MITKIGNTRYKTNLDIVSSEGADNTIQTYYSLRSKINIGDLVQTRLVLNFRHLFLIGGEGVVNLNLKYAYLPTF